MLLRTVRMIIHSIGEHQGSTTKLHSICKESGTLVRPALRLNGRPFGVSNRTTSSKNVQFDTEIEDIRYFQQYERPLAVSTIKSSSKLRNAVFQYSLDRALSEQEPNRVLFSHRSAARGHQPIHLESLLLSPDKRNIGGAVTIENLAFEKSVTVRFTLDNWNTISEVEAEYEPGIQCQNIADRFDLFVFYIKLSEVKNLETKELILCIRYVVEGREYWDNNSAMNYSINFTKATRTAK